MNRIIQSIEWELQQAHPYTTNDVRKISAKHFRQLETTSKKEVFALCEAMLQTQRWPLKVIAFDWAYRVRNQYTLDTFDTFEHWLCSYIRDWSDCDDFCTHAFGELMVRYPELLINVMDWCDHEHFAIRRAAPVVLIVPIKRKTTGSFSPFDVCEALLDDPHYLVQKGFGWMLKVYSTIDREKVYDYLKNQGHRMQRIALRYAIEKLPSADKKYLMHTSKAMKVDLP